ncbi:hypothetical protein PHYSODRAFT_296617 [Phytophthora sojae]|uniref:Uncharacterized protein n=1 Tax=Phytophthora sojae (strain P6497) TaxID=1094619 RepID=G4YZA9_PHYSP|nr:hypothetical protein PHYSODRAFT_296617 [Phytophthora sojae]EGZ24584.1 hypothetical protein PHYSODRAFT_296617 [Phytophthora sojae]|eukprot:XP_009519872.1 hypothetical protein PHYSODRAFT_296617 [Phytophthora sojae]
MAIWMPSAEATHSTSQEFVHSLAIDPRYGGALKAYQEVAYRLKDDPKVRELADILRDIPTHERSTPFPVLESSSGTGKTQMAFNLQAADLEIWGRKTCTQPTKNDRGLSDYA